MLEALEVQRRLVLAARIVRQLPLVGPPPLRVPETDVCDSNGALEVTAPAHSPRLGQANSTRVDAQVWRASGLNRPLGFRGKLRGLSRLPSFGS